MSRKRHGLHSALMLVAVGIHLGQNSCQSNAFPRANVFHSDIKLKDAPQRFGINVAHIKDNRIPAAVDRQLYRRRTRLGIDYNGAFHINDRVGEKYGVTLVIRIGDRAVYGFFAGILSYMLNKEFQRRALVCGNAKLFYLPLNGIGIYEHGASLCRAELNL